MNTYPPGRRDFLKKITALGAAGVPGVPHHAVCFFTQAI